MISVFLVLYLDITRAYNTRKARVVHKIGGGSCKSVYGVAPLVHIIHNYVSLDIAKRLYRLI